MGLLKKFLIRRSIEIPQKVDPSFSVKLATEPHEIMQAYQLIYGAYLKKGLVKENDHTYRMTKYHLLPTTFIAVAKYGDEVIGTISVVVRGRLGLPVESMVEISEQKFQGHQILEVSNFAIAPKWRKHHAVFLLLTKFYYMLASDYLNADYSFIVVHPKAKDLYQTLFYFEDFGVNTLNVGHVEGAEGVVMYHNIKSLESRLKKDFEGKGKRDLYQFMCKQDLPCFEFPNLFYYQVCHNHLTIEMMDFYSKTVNHEISSLGKINKESIYVSYPHLRDLLKISIEERQKFVVSTREKFRFDVSCPVSIYNRDGQCIGGGVALDASENGLCINFSEITHPVGDIYSIIIEAGPKRKIKLRVSCSWVSKKMHKLGIFVHVSSQWMGFISRLEEQYRQISMNQKVAGDSIKVKLAS